jgi:hypothetical protein
MTFGWWARAVGEHHEHLKHCKCRPSQSHAYEYSANCRGCPAGCFTDEELDEAERQYEKPQG